MGTERPLRRANMIRVACMLALLGAAVARAEQLPIKQYTTEDGLAHDRIKHIARDSRGFLWFSTARGLCRFDGVRMRTFLEGLPNPSTNFFLETRSGHYWVATNGGGVARFAALPLAAGPWRAAPQEKMSRFVVYRVGEAAQTNRVNVLYEDRRGSLWAGTDGGLFRLDSLAGQFAQVTLNVPGTPDLGVQIWQLAEDPAGDLWVATNRGLLRRVQNGRLIHYAEGARDTLGMAIDGEGRVYTAGAGGLLIFRPLPAGEAKEAALWRTLARLESRVRLPVAPGEAVWSRLASAPSANALTAVFFDSGGHLWLSAQDGSLSVFDGRELRRFAAAEGLRTSSIAAIAEDRAGNLWLGTPVDGVFKFPRSGFVNYQRADGLGGERIISISDGSISDGSISDRSINGEPTDDGENDALYIVTERWRISRLANGRLETVRPNLPPAIEAGGRKMVRDRFGEWWVPTAGALYRFPRVRAFGELARVRPKAIYTTRDGLTEPNLMHIFEDSRSDIWVSAFAPTQHVLTRWSRTTGKFHHYGEVDGLPSFNAPSSYAEDRAGNVWIGFREGGLARYAGGRFRFLSGRDGVPGGSVTVLYVDRQGRLWIGINPGGIGINPGGIGLIEDPAVADPRPTFPAAPAVAGLQARVITGDEWGRIYFGNDQGINRFDSGSGRVRHYTTADGLAHNFQSVAYTDHRGMLWFGTFGGLSRLSPEFDQRTAPPSVLIEGLRIGDEDYAVPELGVGEVEVADLSGHQNRVSIDFLGTNFTPGEVLRYQYKLEGADRDWVAPTEGRGVNYANLAPGMYRFLVRAINLDGTVSAAPAAVRFRVLPPVWKRWWFLTLVAAIFAGGLLIFDRYRVARMKELDAALTEAQRLAAALAVQGAELHRHNRTLTLEYEVTRVLAESATPEEAASRILRAICEGTGWEGGAIWDVEPGLGALRRAEVWRMPDVGPEDGAALEAVRVLAPGAGLPGQVAVDRQPHWVADLDDRAGWHSSFGFPVLLRGEVVGVLEFFHRERREPDPVLLTMMTTIGSQIGQLLERKRAEEALRLSREDRMAELERVRRRIATDLHDDIGSSLTQISILSEVVRQRLSGNGAAAEPLAKIAGASRELIDAMSDIVWAINPQKDHLSDLLQRMRRFASDSFTARRIDFHFNTPDHTPDHAPNQMVDLRLGADIRREVFLIFKEGINNILKHADCAKAEIAVRIDGAWLELQLRDDGRGFDIAHASEGHGLASMRDRARGLGAEFTIDSEAGRGTLLTLRVRLDRPARSAEIPT